MAVVLVDLLRILNYVVKVNTSGGKNDVVYFTSTKETVKGVNKCWREQSVFVDVSVSSHPFLASDGIPNKLFPLILAARLNSLKPSINIQL